MTYVAFGLGVLFAGFLMIKVLDTIGDAAFGPRKKGPR